jgi:hypothetical protein
MNRRHTDPILEHRRATLSSCLLFALAVPLLAGSPAARAADVIVGNGKAASESRATAEFNAVSISGGLPLRLKQGSPASVVVHGDANLLPLIETTVEGDKTLHLRWKPNTSVRTTAKLWIDVVAPQVQALTSAGSSDVEIDTMKVPQLAVSVRGSGDVRAKGLDADAVSLAIRGSGDMKLAGRAAKLSVDLAGSGNVEAADLRCDDVTVGIAGSGNAVVHASRKLSASIAGSGDVVYIGEPSVQRSIAGSGSVRKR